MKISKQKFLVAGLLAGALTFVGCKSDSSAERTGTTDTTQTPPATGTGTDTTTGTGTEGTGTQTNPGTGGSGNEGDISTTKPSDDNLRMPEDDPLRLKTGDKSVRQGESEEGVHEGQPLEPESGTGGSGSVNDRDAMDDNLLDDNLNQGGDVDDTLRFPPSPLDETRPDGLGEDSQIPEGAR